MEQPLITIIVPVYNAEFYLDRCVNSIREQTYRNLEIILVDDGSPDRCGEMCDCFAQEDSRIRVIHKKNGGQADARNVALDVMRGEYVGFVDSDDWIEPNMYDHLYSLLSKYNVLVSACGAQMHYPNGCNSYFNLEYPANRKVQVYSKIEALRDMMQPNQHITYALWDKLFHRSVFSSLRMTVGKIFEDEEILPECIERVEQIVYDPVPLYHYNQTESSTTRGRFHVKRFAQVDIAHAKAKKYFVQYPELYPDALAAYIATSMYAIYNSYKSPGCMERREELIRDLQKKFPQDALKKMCWKNRLKLCVLRVSPHTYQWITALYHRLHH